jgi:hypothetical protein
MITLKAFAEDKTRQQRIEYKLKALPLQFDSDQFVNLLLNEVKSLAD